MSIDDPAFNINFVKVVEKHPCLWNHTLNEHSRRNVTENAWTEVAKEIKDSVPNCRERWRNIRTAFVRSLTKRANGSTTKTRKPYYLNVHLQFLVPYTKGNPNRALINELNKPPDEEDNKSDNDIVLIEDYCPSTSSEMFGSSTTEMENTNCESPREQFYKKQRLFLAGAQDEVENAFIQCWMDLKNRKTSEEDHDMLFLRSLLPDMKKMTDKQKRRFKRKILDVIDEILDGPESAVGTHLLS